MDKLVLRCGLGAMLALAALPLTVHAQTAPPPAAPPVAAPVEPVAPALAPAPVVADPVAPAPAPEPATVTTLTVEPPPPAAAPPEEPAAEPAAAGPTITGYIEAGYHANFSDLSVRNTPSVPMRVYDPAGHSFTLHAAHLAISHKFTDNISAVIEIDAGRDAVATSGLGLYPWGTSQRLAVDGDATLKVDGDPMTRDAEIRGLGISLGSQFALDIQEAYANYSGGGFTLTAGKFVTYEGIEVIEGPLNPTITRGFLYGYAEAFTHTGVKLHYQPIDSFNIGVGVVNGWDQVTDLNSAKTLIARIAVTPSDKFFAALSGSIGSEQADNKHPRSSIDLTGAITPSASFALWYQANLGAEQIGSVKATWWGIGLQPVITAGDFTLGGRLELFADPKGVRTTFAHTKFYNITITPGYKLGAFKVRGELRADIASGKGYDKVLTKGKNTQFTGALSAEYTF